MANKASPSDVTGSPVDGGTLPPIHVKPGQPATAAGGNSFWSTLDSASATSSAYSLLLGKLASAGASLESAGQAASAYTRSLDLPIFNAPFMLADAINTSKSGGVWGAVKSLASDGIGYGTTSVVDEALVAMFVAGSTVTLGTALGVSALAAVSGVLAAKGISAGLQYIADHSQGASISANGAKVFPDGTTALTLANGSTQYVFSSGLTYVAQPNGSSTATTASGTAYTFDSSMNVLGVTLSNRVAVGFSANGQTGTVTDALGSVTTLTTLPGTSGGSSYSVSTAGAAPTVVNLTTGGDGSVSISANGTQIGASVRTDSQGNPVITTTDASTGKTQTVSTAADGTLVTTTTLHSGDKATQIYNAAGQVTGETVNMANGARTDVSLDPGAGTGTSNSYNASGILIGQTSYAPRGDGGYAVTVSGATGEKASVTTFDASNQRISETIYNPDGTTANSSNYGYDATGTLKTLTQFDGAGKTASITTYGANQQVTSVESFTYGANGALVSTSTTDANGAPVIAPPPPSTTPTGAADPIHTSVTAQDGAGRPTQVTYYNAAGQNIGGDSIVYNAAGQVIGFTLSSAAYSETTGWYAPAARDGSWCEVLRNGDGTISRIISHLANGSLGSTTNFVYHDDGSRTLAIVQPNGQPLLTSTFDTSGHFTSTQVGTSKAHVDYGRLADGGYTLTKYDDSGKQVQVDHFGADGKEIDQTVINHNPDGSVSGKTVLSFATDAKGNRSSTTYDASGRIVETASVGMGNVKVDINTYQFNPDGSRDVTHTDSMGNIISKEHLAPDGSVQDRFDQFNDAQGRLHVKITHPDGKYLETIHANTSPTSPVVEQRWIDRNNATHVRTPSTEYRGGFHETFNDPNLGPVELMQMGPGGQIVLWARHAVLARLPASAGAIGFDFSSVDVTSLTRASQGGTVLPGMGIGSMIPGEPVQGSPSDGSSVPIFAPEPGTWSVTSGFPGDQITSSGSISSLGDGDGQTSPPQAVNNHQTVPPAGSQAGSPATPSSGAPANSSPPVSTGSPVTPSQPAAGAPGGTPSAGVPSQPPVTQQGPTRFQMVDAALAWTSAPVNSLFSGDASFVPATYTVTLANGESLPAWVTYDPTGHTLKGTPGKGSVGTLDIMVTATDASGKNSRSGSLELLIQSNVYNVGAPGIGFNAPPPAGVVQPTAAINENGDNSTVTSYGGSSVVLISGAHSKALFGGNSVRNDITVTGEDDGVAILATPKDTIRLEGARTNLFTAGTDTITGHETGANITFAVGSLSGKFDASVIKTAQVAGNVTVDNSGSDTTLELGIGHASARLTGANAVVKAGSGVYELEFGGSGGVLSFASGVTADHLWLQHTGNDLKVSEIGTTGAVTLKNWYAATPERASLASGDGKTLSSANVEKLVQAMAAFAPPAPATTSLTPDQQKTLQPVLAANWH